MNRNLLIGILVLVCIAGALLYFFTSSSSNQTGSSATTTNSFPSAGTVPGGGISTTTSTTKLSLISRAGGTILVNDFRTNPSVTANAHNTPGYYLLVGNPDPVAAQHDPYEIHFFASDQSFGISLYKEPIGSYRVAAQQKLMQMLGVSQSDMCSLNYVVAVGPGVNLAYQGKNLGFSFCPGAVTLPQ